MDYHIENSYEVTHNLWGNKAQLFISTSRFKEANTETPVYALNVRKISFKGNWGRGGGEDASDGCVSLPEKSEDCVHIRFLVKLVLLLLVRLRLLHMKMSGVFC
jgi:hypothetical protein